MREQRSGVRFLYEYLKDYFKFVVSTVYLSEMSGFRIDELTRGDWGGNVVQ